MLWGLKALPSAALKPSKLTVYSLPNSRATSPTGISIMCIFMTVSMKKVLPREISIPSTHTFP